MENFALKITAALTSKTVCEGGRRPVRHLARSPELNAAAPIRRASRRAGTFERTWFRPITGPDVLAVIKAADNFERESRKRRRAMEPGARNGLLGEAGLRVLRALAHFVDWRTGRLEPSIWRICDRTGLSRKAVCDALARLRDHGFIAWSRRWEPTGNRVGQLVKQLTNAYVILTQRIAKPEPWPIPSDAELLALARQNDRKAMQDELSCAESVTEFYDVKDDRVARSLAALGSKIDAATASPLYKRMIAESLSKSIPATQKTDNIYFNSKNITHPS